jgi:hypothetical protein
MRRSSALAAIVIGICCAPSCADVFGLDQLELSPPSQDASLPPDGSSGAAGDASSDLAIDGPADAKPDVPGADAKDTSVDTADAAKDAVDAQQDTSEDQEDGDATSDADGATICPPGQKSCSGVCVMANKPYTGCGAQSCDPCALDHAAALCDSNLQCAISKCVYGYDDCNGITADGCETAFKVDPANCGTCGHACSFEHAQATCLNSVCSMGSCDLGWSDCDGNEANGCEGNTGADPLNCGACGNACSYAHATAVCQNGTCALGSCSGQFEDCDGDVTNGCEVNLQSDPSHCGACATICGGNKSCVNAVCTTTTCPAGFGECDGNTTVMCETDLTANLNHCGACGNACQFANASAVCTQGQCHIQACTAPYGNCDTNESNGCETNLKNSLQNCSQCGSACLGAANASPTCLNGACGLSCISGYGDCDGNKTNGCEADFLSSGTCGSCSLSCPSAPNSVATCSGGVCGIACKPGFDSCDGDPANGCEADLSDLATCGGCTTKCSTNNGVASCVQGACAIACSAGWGNCDGNLVNGCEESLATVASCGACGVSCANANGTTSCTGGVCNPVCAAGYASCDADPKNGCETATTTTTNCGACSVACALAHANSTCATGVCAVATCSGTYANCDGNAANGCEINTNIDTANCGGCNTVCGGEHAKASCSAGKCAIACDTGWGDCDSDAANGCETDLNANLQHCGTCSTVCSAAHATSSCFGGACQIGGCDAGWGNCNGTATDGCEKQLNVLTDCGGCGKTCSFVNAAASCGTGTCVIASCNAGFGDCDGLATNGCEVNTNTSDNHCGSCATVCSSTNGTPSCVAGACSITCSIGFGDCDSNVATGCETSLNTTSSCGTCGKACTNPNGSTSCVSGVCTPQCSAGAADCDTNPANGCEINTQTSPGNCGACGVACANPNGTTSCVAGTCTPVCGSGFGNCDGLANNGCETPLNTTSYCGNCVTSCINIHGTTTCAGGTCTPVCSSDFGNCDGNPANGCETDTTANVNHCGTCGNGCNCPNGSANCNAGVCACTTCNPGTGNCDGNSANGCETLLTSLTDCGACGVPCSRANATPTCATGSCEIVSCNTGYGDCDALDPNGCETNTQTNLSHCGSCATACSSVNGVAACSLGACSITCNTGFGNCDTQVANGCEASLATVQNCGTCGNACTNTHGTTVCTSGVCVPTCAAGYSDCDGNPANGCETNVTTSVGNCGACGTACTNAHGTTSCVAGVCTPVCASGYGDCDGNPNNGCGANLVTSASNCGTCGKACTNANGTTSCVAGVCTPVCTTGYGDCDANSSNGCETNTQTSLGNCGACGAVCGATNATPSCALGSCSITCDSGYGNCNGNLVDGCEASLNAVATCGSCSVSCTNAHGTTSCASGTCVPGCSAGWGNCDNLGPNGCETALTTTTDCGMCGAACTNAHGTTACTSGLCTPTCTAGWGNCDALGPNGCETQLNTLIDCAACGMACTRTNAAPTCASGACAIGTCNAGYGNCNATDSDGCEAALNTTTNCGACATACTNAHGTTVCTSGACVPTCAAGFGNCDGNAVNGCETDLTTNVNNCGTCGHVCTSAIGTPTCVSGICTKLICDPKNTQIAACWQFESSTTPGQDTSAYNNNATTSGVSIVAGHDGNAIQMGATSVASLTDRPSLDVTAVTIEAWIYPTSISTTARVGIFDNDGQYGFFINAGGVLYCSAACGAASPGGTVKANVWQHVACTLEGGYSRAYLNGTQVASVACGTALSTTGTNGSRIGANSPSGDNFLGLIDSMRIWNVGRTRAQLCAGAGLICL